MAARGSRRTVLLVFGAFFYHRSPTPSWTGAGPMNCHRFIFGEASGNLTYDSIGSATGTLTNVTRPFPGHYGLGNSVQLQASPASHIDFSQPVGQFGTADFTVILWLKTRSEERRVGKECRSRWS